ncbi:MAG TPA: hypothetical protein PKA38_01335 [Candidatus Levybacteria bacterium]|nr:hypothetical protein [Candidatus Levybacteria bacterium]
MDNFNKVKSELVQLISENTGIGIVVSSNQTLDVLAAAISLHLMLQDSGKNSQVASQKNPTVEHSFLVGIDQLKNSFSGLTRTLTVSFPYHDGDIEKVSYNIEGDRLNVNLFAEEQGIGFTEKDIKYIRQGSSPNLIITIGVLQASEIDGLVGQETKIINIDNSVHNSMFGQVNIVDASYSSLSELVAKIASELQFVIEFDVAQNLLDGIASATNNFMSPKTSPLAFEMAGFLMQKGAIRKDMKESRIQRDESLELLGKKTDNITRQIPRDGGFNKTISSAPQDRQIDGMQNMAQEEFGNEEVSSQINAPKRQSVQSSSHPSVPQPEPFTLEENTSVLDNIPSEDEAPSDWFTPKVFKSTKGN